MKTLVNNKGMLAATFIFILVIFFYNIFFKSETIPESAELSASSTGDDLVKIFEELQAVTLDPTLFSSPGYLLLTDFSTAIPPQTTGRPNPFGVIGQD